MMSDALVPQLQEQAAWRETAMLPAHLTDVKLMEMWLHGKGELTQKSYRAIIQRLMTFTNHTPLQRLTLLDLQGFADSLAHLKPATRGSQLAAVKSLLTFCQQTGYTTLNVGAALRLPKVTRNLTAKILTEATVQRVLAMETQTRNHALLRVFYNTGMRVSELRVLTWGDVIPRATGGQVHVVGKGEKERSITLSEETYQEVLALRGEAPDHAPVFVSRKQQGFLSRQQLWKIVKQAGVQAQAAVVTNGPGVRSRVSPHWLRHAHASHALDRGAPLSLVRDTLGHANIATTNIYSHARPETSSGDYLPI